eukprot:1137690-Pelagomonas_calceolata.AAC.1
MKAEHIPTGWNWSKLHTGHAPPYVYPPNCNPANGDHAPKTLLHPDSRTYSNPLFDAQDIEVENASPGVQNSPSPSSQPLTEVHTCQDGYTCKRNNSFMEAPQTQAHGIDHPTPFDTPHTGPAPGTHSNHTNWRKEAQRGVRDPTYLGYHTQPIKTQCLLPPNTLDADVAQWLWNYKQNKAAEFNTAQASNTIFRYDHVIKKTRASNISGSPKGPPRRSSKLNTKFNGILSPLKSGPYPSS